MIIPIEFFIYFFIFRLTEILAASKEGTELKKVLNPKFSE